MNQGGCWSPADATNPHGAQTALHAGFVLGKPKGLSPGFHFPRWRMMSMRSKRFRVFRWVTILVADFKLRCWLIPCFSGLQAGGQLVLPCRPRGGDKGQSFVQSRTNVNGKVVACAWLALYC